MAFYEGTAWPVDYRGRLFFADFNSAWIGMFNLNAPDQSFAKFASDAGALVDMEATDEGIYAVSIYDQSIKFIYYDVESNHPPVATISTTVVSGSSPLYVEFLATATDADNDDLVYSWDFGDGVTLITPEATATHVYTQDGDYLATLQVIDEDDGKSEILTQLIQVYSGEVAGIVQENITEPGRVLYQGGDEIDFKAMRTVGTTGLDPEAPYAWTILLHHNEHAHILLAEYISNTVTLDIPIHTHALGVPLWYEVELAMRTASGQILRTVYELRPQTTTIQLQSWPGQTAIHLNQQRKFPQELTTVIVGQEYVVEAPESIVYNGQVGRFQHWFVTNSWPGADTVGAEIAETGEIIAERQYTLTATIEPKTYIAYYEYIGTASQNFLPSVNNERIVAE
jgi:PKD repeat protein